MLRCLTCRSCGTVYALGMMLAVASIGCHVGSRSRMDADRTSGDPLPVLQGQNEARASVELAVARIITIPVESPIGRVLTEPVPSR